MSNAVLPHATVLVPGQTMTPRVVHLPVMGVVLLLCILGEGA